MSDSNTVEIDTIRALMDFCEDEQIPHGFLKDVKHSLFEDIKITALWICASKEQLRLHIKPQLKILHIKYKVIDGVVLNKEFEGLPCIVIDAEEVEEDPL